MRKSHPIKYTALVAALASAYPLHVLANAGITQFSVGEVSVQRATTSAPLASGSRIESGDLITTGSSGRTQLRFTDGGMVSLQPNSQFKISRYADSGDARQDSFLVDLARGGMRAITGLIGKRNRENYKVTTNTATIGIRGSGFSMAYNPDGTLSITTELDAIQVCNQAGCVNLNLGESALVVNANTLPTRVFQRAAFVPPNPRRLITARNDDVDRNGQTASIRVETGLALTSAGLDDDGGRDIRAYLEGAAAGNANTGTILGYVARGESGTSGDLGKNGEITVLQRTGSLATGDLTILGTWQDAEWSANQSQSEGSTVRLSQSAFVMGVPTPNAALEAAAGKQARYDLSQATQVFSSSSLTEGTLLPSSHVMVNFGNATRNLDIELNVSMGRVGNEVLTSSNPEFDAVQLTYIGSAQTGSAGFAGDLSLSQGQSGAGRFKGFFGGPAAEKLGVSYEADALEYGDIAGAGVFIRGALTSPPNVAVSGVGIGAGTAAAYLQGTLVTVEGDGTQYTAANGDTIQVTSLNAIGPTGQPGDQDFLAFGQWQGLTWNQNGNNRSDSIGAFVMGTPTPVANLPTADSRGVYHLNTATPVYSTGNQGSGELLSSSHLTIDFLAAGQYVDVALDVRMPGLRPQSLFESPLGNEQPLTVSQNTEYSLRGSAAGIDGAFKGILSVSTFACSNGGGSTDNCGTGSATGFIAGPNADNAGLSFSANTQSSMHGVIYGAGVFSLGEGQIAPTPNTTFGVYDYMQVLSASIQGGEGVLYSGSSYNGASGSFKGSFLQDYTEAGYYYPISPEFENSQDYSYSSPPTYAHVANTSKSFAAIGSPTDDDFIGWGYWQQGTKTTQQSNGYGYTSYTEQVDHLHYLVGKPTSNYNVPSEGSASYSFIGGTQPTATSNGSTQLGQILPSSNLAVNFGNHQVDANINLKFGQTDANFTATGWINGSRIQSCGSPSQVNGFFAGSGAIRAGVVYQHEHGTLGTIQGAAAFQRTSGSVGTDR